MWHNEIISHSIRLDYGEEFELLSTSLKDHYKNQLHVQLVEKTKDFMENFPEGSVRNLQLVPSYSYTGSGNSVSSDITLFFEVIEEISQEKGDSNA